jgi:hypothetical protein
MIKIQEYKKWEAAKHSEEKLWFKQVSNITSAGAAGPSLVKTAQNDHNPRLLTDM